MQDITYYLNAFAVNFPAIQGLILVLGFLLGLYFVVSGFVESNKSKRSQSGEGTGLATAKIIFGSLMCAVIGLSDTLSYTVFMADANPQMITAYTPATGTKLQQVAKVVFSFLALYGWFAYLKGCWEGIGGVAKREFGWGMKVARLWGAAIIATNFTVALDTFGVSVGSIAVGSRYFSF